MSLALKPLLLVFLGGGLGSVLRLCVLHASRLLLPPGFPYGTMIVNVAGGLVAGAIAAALVGREAGGNDPAGLFLLTGLLGGFTTFSAFGLDTMLLWQKGEAGMAILYVVASVILSVVAAAAGFSMVRILS